MFYHIDVPGVCADITFIKKKGKKQAVATAISIADGEKIPELPPAVSRPQSERFQELAINEALTKLVSICNEYYGKLPPTPEEMEAAFQQVKDAVMTQHAHLTSRWRSDSTNQQAISFFWRNTLPLLLPFSNPEKRLFLPTDRSAIEEELAASIATRNGGNLDLAKESARKRMNEASIIYSHMIAANDRLPALKLVTDFSYQRVMKKEQVKHLPPHVLSKFYSILTDMVKTDPKFVFFAIMVIYGMRPAEAAARNPSEIIWHDTYCVLPVDSQAVDGKLTNRLKNLYSYRIVVISFWGRELLDQCCQLIGDDFPRSESGIAMNKTVDCAQRVKNILINECGCSESDLFEASESVDDQDLDPEDLKDKTGELRTKKISCYVLRRVFATMARGVMALSLNVTDRLMGHIPLGSRGEREAKVRSVDLTNPETQKSIADKMERYIISPTISLNPSVRPYKLSTSSILNVIEYSVITIVNDSNNPVTLDFVLTASEQGEVIIIDMPVKTAQNLRACSIPKSWNGCDRTVIGETAWLENKKGGDKNV